MPLACADVAADNLAVCDQFKVIIEALEGQVELERGFSACSEAFDEAWSEDRSINDASGATANTVTMAAAVAIVAAML